MEKIEFKSQICTTREQSERLLALGLSANTADMSYYIDEMYGSYNSYLHPHPPTIKGTVPAWSLHRLIEIASDVQKIPISFVNWIHSDVQFDYDHLIDVIQWLIECGYINEFCLEEK